MDNELALVKVEAVALAERPRAIRELVAQFIQEQDITAGSRETYTRSLRRLITWLEETGRIERLHELTREDILGYKEQLVAEGLSSYTINSYLASTRRLFQWLESRRIFPDITRAIRGLKKARGFRKDCLSPEQIRAALDGLAGSRLEAMRDYALFNLLARTGLRTIEAARALVEDIRQEAGQPVLLVQGKGRDSKDDFVLLVPEALEPIQAYLRARGHADPAEPLFCSHSDRNAGEALTTRSISRIVKQALRRAGLDSSRLTAHSLRHTAITLALRGGASLQQAQAMARHADPKTTMIYSHNISRVAEGAERCIRF